MKEVRQFTVFLENKPGRLHQLCAALAKQKVSIHALTVMDSKDHNVLRFVVDDAAQCRSALAKLGVKAFETDVVTVELKSQAGALANLCERLASEHVNIDYMYCSNGAGNGKALAVLKAAPLDRVRSALAEAPKPKKRVVVRRPPVRR